MKKLHTFLLTFFLVALPGLSQERQAPIATTTRPGLVKPDGSTITITTDGTITSVGGGGGPTNGITAAQAGQQIKSTNDTFIIPDIGTVGQNNTNYSSAISNALALQFNLGASGFVTLVTNGSSTAQIQAAFNSMTNSGVVSFAPGTYTISATLSITNPMIIEGNGAIFSFGSGLTNFMLDTGTNYQKSLLIEHLNFDGGEYLQYFSTNFFLLTHRALNLDDVEPYFNPNWHNRSGLRAECSRGVTINGCTFSGFHGNGAVFLNRFNVGAFDSDKLILRNCRFATNFIGCLLATGAEAVKAYVSNDVTGVFEENCEYATVQSSDFRQNYIGISACAGNAKVEANQIVRNWIGLRLGGANNDTHGSYQMNTINHNNWGLWDQASVGGGIIANNVFLRNDFNWSNDTNQLKQTAGIHFDNVQSFFFVNNRLGAESLTFSNGCIGIFAHNTFESNSVWTGAQNGTDFSQVYTNFSPTVSVFGNMDNYGNSLDGSALSVVEKSTNAATPGAVLISPNGTNSAWTTTPSFPSITASNWNPLQGYWRAAALGDSRTAGTFTSGVSYFTYLVNYFLSGVFTFTTNAAVSGFEINSMALTYTNGGVSLFKPSGGTNGLMTLDDIGVNDIANGSNAATVIRDWSNLVFMVTADKWNVVASTIMPEDSFSSSQIGVTEQVNEYILTNGMTLHVVDANRYFAPILQYTLDGVHPTTNTSFALAGHIANELRKPPGFTDANGYGLVGNFLNLSTTATTVERGWGVLGHLIGPFSALRFEESGSGASASFASYQGKATIRMSPNTGNEAIVATFEQTGANILAPLAAAGSIAFTNGAVCPTNFVAANFAPVAGSVKLCFSNNAAYWVTQLATNKIGAINP